MKKVAALIVLAAAATLPIFASAATVDELTAQVQALIAQIQALQAATPSVATSSPTPIASPSAPQQTLAATGACPALSRSLARGATGDDVRALQAFLSTQSSAHYAAPETGFYGPATELAVQNWQAAQGIVANGDPFSTGWGAVGALTRAAIARACVSAPAPTPQCAPTSPPLTICSTGWRPNTDAYGCTTSYTCSIPLGSTADSSVCSGVALVCPWGKHDQVSANCSHLCVDDSTALQLTARPSSGAAPLAVVFEGFGSVGGGRPVTLDFGDGQVDPSIAVVGSFKRSHIYTKRGSYQPRIIDSVLGTVFATTTQITVTDASAVTSTIVSAYVSAPRVGSGDTMSISWSATNPPADTGIVLDLYKANNADATSTKIGTIALSSLPAGSTTWTVPFGGGACTLQFPNGLCGVNLTGGFYFVRASLVSGNLFAQPPVVIASGDSSQFSVNQ